ncbi:MAG: hypothetical protein V2J62_08715 [candidate division KSB1 bacterium]|jgi:xylan 1,4-beta-xylosidase|nr:hypothetical protein [candidate division KSB1 bacterium]
MWKKIGILAIVIISVLSVLLFANRDKAYNFLRQNRYTAGIVKAMGVHASGISNGSDDSEHNDPDIKEISVQIDAGAPIGIVKDFYNGIGMGSFKDGVLKRVNRAFFEMVAKTNEDLDFVEYVGMKSIFKDKPKKWGADDGAHVVSRDAAGNIVYHWDIVDAVIDALVKQYKFKPIISFTFMPEALAANPNRKNPWHKGIVSPPEEYMEWRNLIYQTVRHLKQRYGAAEIRSWYFEVWNEPDYYQYFWIAHPDKKKFPKQSDHDSFCRFYDYTVDGALAADPHIKIGGPGLAGDRRFLREFLDHCYQGTNYVTGKTGARLDFVSRHHYGNIEERIIPQYRSFMDEIVKYSGVAFDELEILITETGPSAMPRPWLNNQYVAAWIAKQFDAFIEMGDEHGSEYIPDVICFWSKPVAVEFGKQFGLTGALGDKHNPLPGDLFRRPAYNAYEAVRHLTGNRLRFSGTSFGDPLHGIATLDSKSDIYVVLYHLLEGDYFNSSTNEVDVSLKIVNCGKTEYTVEHFAVSSDFSNCYARWQEMGSPKYPTSAQWERLKGREALELVQPVRRVRAENGNVALDVPVSHNSLVLLKLINTSDNLAPESPSRMNVNYDATLRTVELDWDEPAISRDGDRASAYEVYRNNDLLVRQFEREYVDHGVVDHVTYTYSVKSLDEAGNASEKAIRRSISIPKDSHPPEVVKITTPDEKTVRVFFNEPLDADGAVKKSNYKIEPEMKIYEIHYDTMENAVFLKTAEHIFDRQYRLNVHNISDMAATPNTMVSFTGSYTPTAFFRDDFNTNSLDAYQWTYVQGPGEKVRFLHDADAKDILVMTGDDTRIKFSKKLPKTDRGRFSMRFTPLTFYPDGGAITIRLLQDESNYMMMNNTDGYGAGKIQKVVNGKVVASKPLTNGYGQNRSYDISIYFDPGGLRVQAFDQEVSLDMNQETILVGHMEIQLTQQDARFDNFYLSRKF